MLHHGGGPIINADKRGTTLSEDEVGLVKWLARVRGPEATDDPLMSFPRPQGPNTRVVVTEYEVPRLFLVGHDVSGDPQGNIWYSSHMTTHVGKLDPRTGIVTQYKIPMSAALPSGYASRASGQARNRLVLGKLGAQSHQP